MSYTHKSRAGLISTTIYRQIQRDVLLPTQVNGSVLPPALFPSTYFGDVYDNFVAACGGSVPFLPQNTPAATYFSTPVGGVDRVYEGAQISTYYTLGRLVVEPYYNIQVAKALSNDVRLNNPYSITIPGEQLPNVPLHRGGITLDYKSPGSILEWLADANYTSANNPQNLPAYTTVDAGVDAHLMHGDLVFAASNIFNTYGAIFSSSQWAVPYTTLGGTTVATIARPNTPRQLSVTYTVRFGQGVPQESSRNALALSAQGENGPSGRGGRGGFRQFGAPLPDAAPADPFAINVTQICNPDAQKVAAPLLGALKSYVAQIDRLKSSAGYPATAPAANIPGLTVQYHGLGATYALSISLTQTAQLRSLFGCSTFHLADQATAQQRNLYLEPEPRRRHVLPARRFVHAGSRALLRAPPADGANGKLPSVQAAGDAAHDPVYASQRFLDVYGGNAHRSADRTHAVAGALCK